MTELSLVHEQTGSLHIFWGAQELARYVYRPTDAQLESPRPYWHPLYTLGGDLVSLYRPHDHVWHKGIAWSLPNVAGPAGTENFWGGPTYLRDRGYQQLANDGAMIHRDFLDLSATGERVGVAQWLDWVTESGATWCGEQRQWSITVGAEHWVLSFSSRITNVTDHELRFGSPTTEGRENAGYGGLFWRGPRSFTGGTAYAPGRSGGDDLMGVRAPWLGFTGQHDEHGRHSTLVFVDATDNFDHPTQWFVRSGLFACVCPAPFFSAETPVEPGASLALRYAVVVADGDPGHDGAEKLAAAGAAALDRMEVGGP